jgi:hypothetical protein
MRIRSGLAGAAVVAVLLAGCGGSTEEAGGGSGSAGASGCLSPAQVNEEINRIGEGAEGSSAEVEAKQDEIAAVQAEAC